MTLYRHRIAGPGSAGDTWNTRFHSNGAASLAAVHTAFQTFVTAVMTNALAAMWPNEFSITELTTDQLDGVTGKNVAQTKSAVSLVGTGTGATPSPRDCLLVSLRTAVPTKAGRGRMYWLAPDSTHTTPTGLLNSTDATSLSNAFGNALTTFKVTSQPVIAHIKRGSVPTFDSITQVWISTTFANQRRRTNKVLTSYASKVV
jgi:hypothetical protein